MKFIMKGDSIIKNNSSVHGQQMMESPVGDIETIPTDKLYDIYDSLTHTILTSNIN